MKINILDKYPSNISLDFIKKYLKIDDNSDDEIINVCIKYAEVYLINNYKISPSKYDILISLNSVPSNFEISPPVLPTQNVLSIKSNSIDIINKCTINQNKSIKFNESFTSVEIVFTCGYLSFTEIPKDILMGIMMHVANLYDNRGSNFESLPKSAKSIYDSYKIIQII